MIESFWKKHWFEMLVGISGTIMAIVFMFVEDADFAVLAYSILSVIWFGSAYIGYNRDCIKALAKRVADLEASAITDIEEESPNYYMVKRRLGPDKEEEK